MNRILLITFNFLVVTTLFSQEKKINSFIPGNYDTLQRGIARGDLNKDGVEDIALAIYPAWENDSDWIEKAGNDRLPQRMLIILFGTKTGYMLSAKSTDVIMCKDCGGIFGDPFEGVEIKNNVLKIYHYGGSSWRWSYTYKFRFQKNNWYLIGKTNYSYWNVEYCEKLGEFAAADYEDINFLTGQYEKRRISDDCKLLENKKGKKKAQPLVTLEKFKTD